MSRILTYLKRTIFLQKSRHYQCRKNTLICSEIAFAEFWFYSGFEENLYQLITQLTQNGYKITVCEPMRDQIGFICLAVTKIDPDPERFDRLVIELQVLAEFYNCVLDGWLRS